MINSIGTSNNINPVKMFSAVSAFKSSGQIQEDKIPETSDGINVSDNKVLDTKHIDEIKQFAQIAGEEHLSNDDIQYGMTYGRSVIADYVI